MLGMNCIIRDGTSLAVVTSPRISVGTNSSCRVSSVTESTSLTCPRIHELPFCTRRLKRSLSIVWALRLHTRPTAFHPVRSWFPPWGNQMGLDKALFLCSMSPRILRSKVHESRLLLSFLVQSEKMMIGDDNDMLGTWSDETTPFGYDFWYQPYFDVMISSQWGAPKAFKAGFNPADVELGNLISFSICNSPTSVNIQHSIWEYLNCYLIRI